MFTFGTDTVSDLINKQSPQQTARCLTMAIPNLFAPLDGQHTRLSSEPSQEALGGRDL